jgi:hypothetical protein
MSIDIHNPDKSSSDAGEADKAVTITEADGFVTIKVVMCTEVVIPRDVLQDEFKESVGALVVERMMLDLELDRDGTDPLFVPAIDKKLVEHLAKG